ncbi:MAG: hypothetical protein WEB00_06455 [Dehalococcoidia bacterium]
MDTSIGSHSSRLAILGGILLASILSTAIHYAHNYVEINQYPDPSWISNSTTGAAILIFWPILTVAGIAGFWVYSQRSYLAAHACLAVYSLTGLTTFGHFMDGNPDIDPFWYATIFTDGLAGFAILAFVAWSILITGREGELPRG